MRERILDKRVKILLLLHVIMTIYSISGVFSKMAAGELFLSGRFCMYYAIVILLLGVYAVGWQQVIKYLPLTAAFMNKSVTVVWGMVWGVLFFKEPVTAGKAAGALLVILGIIIYAGAEEKGEGGSHNS